MGSSNTLDHLMQSYGDLLFDLCESMFRNTDHSQIVFRSILKKINFESRFRKYSRYERAWIVKTAFEQLLEFCHQTDSKTSPLEQIKLDGSKNVSIRLDNFNSYFHRLMPEDQILLLLKDKYGFPDTEISTVMSTPVGSLKIRRQQALRALEEWLWNGQ